MDSYTRRSPSDRFEDRPRTDSWTGDRDDFSRRRSPQGRGGRDRSRSPPRHIDRYQPGRGAGGGAGGGGAGGRDDYAPRDRYRRRSPPPSNAQANIDRYVPGQEPPATPLANPLPDPLKLDYQVGFNWFAEWWRKDQEVKEERERQKKGERRPPPRIKSEAESREQRDKEREKIQNAYDSYKEKLQIKMAREFVHLHKSEEWFKEKYEPEVRDGFRERLARFRRENHSKWQQDLENSVFDEFTLEGIYKSESDGAGGVVEKEEGEATNAAEVLGVGDLLPCKGGDLRDDASQQSALLIKTIAPHVSRDKMEAFCKEHLGEAEGGFHWLSLSDPNPQKKCHRIGWVILNPGGDDVEEPAEKEQEEEGEQMDTTQEKRSGADKALAELNGKSIVDEERGNFTCHVGIHNPPSQPRKKALWDLFSAPERVERDLQLIIRMAKKLEEELGDEQSFDGVGKVEERVEHMRAHGQLQPTANQKRPGEDDNAMKDEDDEQEEGEEPEDEDDDIDDEELLAKKKKLDMLVEYLRRVFNFCFFCVFESDSVHELMRKCPGGHLRRPRASLTTSAKNVAKASAWGEPFPLKKEDSQKAIKEEDNDATMEEKSPSAEQQQQQNARFDKRNKTHQQLQRAFNWVKTYEDKLFQILEPDEADLGKLGGRPLNDALEEELKKFVKQEDESKFRCKAPECTKLFKAETFWRKHVEKRHAEWYEAMKKDLQLINNYVIDPAHITPSRNDATSNGHFPVNNFPTGTPRGFNLANMGPQFGMGGGGMAGGLPMTLAAMQSQFGGAFPMMPDGGNVGPTRTRGGSRFNNRMPGPYDRQGKDSRGMRWNNNAGNRVPSGGPMGMVTGGMTMRFPDAQAEATVGPKAATEGRVMKSYQDLDAVGGGSGAGNNGELDY